MLLFILFAQRLRMAQHCFNTSHVTLYPSRLLSVQCRRVFQYISCYSLSMQKRKNKGGRKKVSIHLMLLFILFRFPVLLKTVSFNTSHVTLYQRSRQSLLAPLRVSIHLMLLFIRVHTERRTV